MSGTPEALYDAHAARIYAYCWALVGDGADAATRDTFVAAMQHPPHGDAVLWMYALARSVCLEHGALSGAFSPGGAARRAGRFPDPLLRAAARLRADHREVLLLSAGQWLDEPDIAVVLGVAPDTVRQLLHTARVRLERAVVDLLMREPGSPYDQEIITAFERGMLPRLLARRAPERPPAALREQVLRACAAELERPLSTMAAPSPLVTIGPVTTRRHTLARRAKGAGAIAALAASAAAAVGLLASWTGSGGGDGLSALAPPLGQGGGPSSTGSPSPDSPGSAKGSGGGGRSPQTSRTDPYYVTQPPSRPAPPPGIPGLPGSPTPAPSPDPAPDGESPAPRDPGSPKPTPDPSAPSPNPRPSDPPSPQPSDPPAPDPTDPPSPQPSDPPEPAPTDPADPTDPPEPAPTAPTDPSDAPSPDTSPSPAPSQDS